MNKEVIGSGNSEVSDVELVTIVAGADVIPEDVSLISDVSEPSE